MKTTQILPHDIASNKVYFVNLFTKEIKVNDFAAAKIHYPRLSAIADKLQPKELEYLIEKIEALL